MGPWRNLYNWILIIFNDFEKFAKIFDGFSIGSNDLTQLTLGIDRDSAIISGLFSEQNEAAMETIATMISKAKDAGVKIGLCGQAPSDFPEFAQFLVEQGIDSISFNPDALLQGIENIKKAEIKSLKEHKTYQWKRFFTAQKILSNLT